MGIGLWELCAAKACPQIDMWGPVNFPTSGNHDDLLQWDPCHIVETHVSIKCSQFVEMGTEKLCFRTCCPEESALKKPDIYSSMINMFFLFTKK